MQVNSRLADVTTEGVFFFHQNFTATIPKFRVFRGPYMLNINIHISILPTFLKLWGYLSDSFDTFWEFFAFMRLKDFLDSVCIHKFFILLTIHNSILSTFPWRFGVTYLYLQFCSLLYVIHTFFRMFKALKTIKFHPTSQVSWFRSNLLTMKSKTTWKLYEVCSFTC